MSFPIFPPPVVKMTGRGGQRSAVTFLINQQIFSQFTAIIGKSLLTERKLVRLFRRLSPEERSQHLPDSVFTVLKRRSPRDIQIAVNRKNLFFRDIGSEFARPEPADTGKCTEKAVNTVKRPAPGVPDNAVLRPDQTSVFLFRAFGIRLIQQQLSVLAADNEQIAVNRLDRIRLSGECLLSQSGTLGSFCRTDVDSYLFACRKVRLTDKRQFRARGFLQIRSQFPRCIFRDGSRHVRSHNDRLRLPVLHKDQFLFRVNDPACGKNRQQQYISHHIQILQMIC